MVLLFIFFVVFFFLFLLYCCYCGDGDGDYRVECDVSGASLSAIVYGVIVLIPELFYVYLCTTFAPLCFCWLSVIVWTRYE